MLTKRGQRRVPVITQFLSNRNDRDSIALLVAIISEIFLAMGSINKLEYFFGKMGKRFKRI